MPYPYYEELIGKRVVDVNEEEDGPFEIVAIFYKPSGKQYTVKEETWEVITYNDIFNSFGFVYTPRKEHLEGGLKVIGESKNKMVNKDHIKTKEEMHGYHYEPRDRVKTTEDIEVTSFYFKKGERVPYNFTIPKETLGFVFSYEKKVEPIFDDKGNKITDQYIIKAEVTFPKFDENGHDIYHLIDLKKLQYIEENSSVI